LVFLSSSEGRHAVDFFRPKNPTASAGFEPAILGTRGQLADHQITEAAVFCQESGGKSSLPFGLLDVTMFRPALVWRAF
jgi:hypothetical protein